MVRAVKRDLKQQIKSTRERKRLGEDWGTSVRTENRQLLLAEISEQGASSAQFGPSPSREAVLSLGCTVKPPENQRRSPVGETQARVFVKLFR